MKSLRGETQFVVVSEVVSDLCLLCSPVLVLADQRRLAAPARRHPKEQHENQIHAI